MSGEQQLAAGIILAAGAGTRMRSNLAKVIHQIAGRTLVDYVITAVAGLKPHRICVVIRHQREQVAAHVLSTHPEVVLADQDDVPGTGRAVWCALEEITKTAHLAGPVLVTAGDTPLLTTELLQGLAQAHYANGNDVTILTTNLQNPHGYGRIVRDSNGQVTAIVEEKDATDSQRQITEVNTSIFVFEPGLLRKALSQVGLDNAQGEMYITDVVAYAVAAGKQVGAHQIKDSQLVEGVNDQSQLENLGSVLLERQSRKQ